MSVTRLDTNGYNQAMPELPLAAINASGHDAFTFLQGQLTNDLERLEAEAEILSAWCNPKGRVIWFGTVTRIEGGYALSVPPDLADDIVKRLLMFRFRAKVEFAIEAADAGVDAEFLITNGYPFIGREQSEEFTPHMLNLDLLDAISMDKGCYTGQEIVARTHYRGKTKRRCLRFESAEPVAAGDKVTEGDRSVGTVVNAAGTDLLAVVPVDKADADLAVNGSKLQHLPLPYLAGL